MTTLSESARSRHEPTLRRLPAAEPAGSAAAVTSSRQLLTAADGHRLTAIRYEPATRPRAHVVVAGAIGVPQSFYRRFAGFAAARGMATMTLDYRGIGLSAPPTLRGFRVDYLDWGRLDLAAAVTAMRSDDVPLFVVGHSYGGHAFGVLPNHALVARCCTFGTGSGWHGWMPWRERLRVLLLWHLVGPVVATATGYLPWRRLGMGEDLPLSLYRQWKRWCRYPNHLFGDPKMQHVAREYAAVTTPLLAANATDDRWSPPPSRDAFLQGYANARKEMWDIEPSRIGMADVGHMGYFAAGAEPLWRIALDWLATGERCRPSR